MSQTDARPLVAQPPLLIFVGGFLGAGKTTLIMKSAALLRTRGERVAVILNDQGSGLVDTLRSLADNVPTREVFGGCFCCNFSQLIDAADQLAEFRPSIIFAEPVGSCVDLSATILQPLRAYHQSFYRLAPLTVLLDPAELARFEQGKMHPDVAFLFRNQMAEADLLCLTKQDLDEKFQAPWLPIDFHLSAHSGQGVEPWINEVLTTTRIVGARLLEVDYDRYAEAETALGWLNLHAHLRLPSPASPASVAGPLLDLLAERLASRQIEVAHLKIFDRAPSGWIKASITGAGGEPLPEGDLLAEPASDHQIALNVRALAEPSILRDVASAALREFGGQLQIYHLGAFRPARPVPQHRFAARAG